MFKFVSDSQELVEDKKSMFGIYAPNVKLLAISPGLKTTFKHFITKVEELIPNLSKRAKRTALRDPESSSKSKAKTIRSTSGESLSKEVKLTTVKDLEQRLLTWISKEVVKRNKDVSEEEHRKSFELKATGSNSFLFTCLQSNCREPCVLRYADKSSSVNMYNAHRHITQSCWLRPNKKPNFSTPVVGNFFETKAKPKDDQPAPRKFVPQHSDDRDFAIVDDDSHAGNMVDKVTVETETAEITDVSSSSKKDESSKNL